MFCMCDVFLYLFILSAQLELSGSVLTFLPEMNNKSKKSSINLYNTKFHQLSQLPGYCDQPALEMTC